MVPQPYAPMAARVGIAEDEFFAVAGRLKAQGYMRRMAAVLRHREAGFRANAMGVWVVPAERAEEVGRVMGSFKGVSHCYLRPTYPDWPYSIFTMVHGQDATDCQEVIDAIARATGIGEYALLYSTKEYKKIRLRYFTPELDVVGDEVRPVARVGGGPVVTDAPRTRRATGAQGEPAGRRRAGPDQGLRVDAGPGRGGSVRRRGVRWWRFSARTAPARRRC